MKVICKKFIYDGKEIKEDSDYWLTKEKDYIVLGIDITESITLLYLQSDTGQAAYFNIKGFDIVSNYIPSCWVVDFGEEKDSMSMYPKSWLEAENFWEEFVEDDIDMVELYEKERDLIYEEEPR